jgi:hypothetical protein
MELRRALVLLSLIGLLIGLAWWFASQPDAPPASSEPSEPPERPAPRARAEAPAPVAPSVHLPQLRAGPEDDQGAGPGPTNLPPGTPRARIAASGKLAFTVIEEYAEAFRACYEQHGTADPDLPAQALLEFTISAEPRDTGDQYGTVREVQVLTGGPDYELMEHNAFEFCCTEAVIELELDPPGGRGGGEARFGMTIDLATGEIVGAPKGPIQAD